MLIVPVLINDRLVDTLFCHNQGETNSKGWYRYRVWLKSDPKRIKELWHRRESGWEELVVKALKILRRGHEKSGVDDLVDSVIRMRGTSG